MMTNTKRVDAIVKMLRSAKPAESGWCQLDIPRIGVVFAHVMPADAAARMGASEVWARVGTREVSATHEFKGSALAVATKIVRECLRTSAKVSEVSDAIVAKGKVLTGFRAEEMAACLGLDEDLVFAAVDYLVDRGLIVMLSEGRGLAWTTC